MKKIEVLGMVNFKLETIFFMYSFEVLEKWIDFIGFKDSCFSIKLGSKFFEVYISNDLKVFYKEIDKEKARRRAII